MNIPANITAVTFFAHKILPLLSAHKPDIKFFIVGSRPARAVLALNDLPNIEVVGEVPSLLPYYAQASVVVVPLFTGGGIIVKTLNGLASGRPVVTTSVGNSGTGAKHERDLLISSPTPEVFSAAILELLDNEQAWLHLAENGRKFIQAHYDWSKTIDSMINFLQEVSEQEP